MCFLFSEPLSDFSISAIQSMRGSSSVPANQETTASLSTKDSTVSSESTNGTKSIATMTVEPKQDKSISPMEFVMRKETGFQYSRFEETKISARLGCLSPTKSSFSSDDTVMRKSIHHQIDLTGTTITGGNDKSRSVISSIKGLSFIHLMFCSLFSLLCQVSILLGGLIICLHLLTSVSYLFSFC